MPSFDIIKSVKPKKSFRVASIMGKYDLQSEKIVERFSGNIDTDVNWQIGVIVGNSGTGKTIIARKLFDQYYFRGFEYTGETILDDFPKSLSVEEIGRLFNSVGFSSPPSWLKPYAVLSNGEKMRVDLARAIAENKDLIVFDEFTSVVDRNVAQIGSAAISKAIKRTDKKFVAVTCHYDVLEWLEPDWVFDTNEMRYEYTRGSLRRPEIKVDIYKQRDMWRIFRKYHYLNHEINHAAIQYVGYINNVPATFCAVLHLPHKIKNIKKCTRLVVLPDYQGVGVGNKMLNWVAEHYIKNGYRFTIVTSTPALISVFKRSGKWRLKRFGRMAEHKASSPLRGSSSKMRFTTSWEYI